jgi:hypothetical protein
MSANSESTHPLAADKDECVKQAVNPSAANYPIRCPIFPVNPSAANHYIKTKQSTHPLPTIILKPNSQPIRCQLMTGRYGWNKR